MVKLYGYVVMKFKKLNIRKRGIIVTIGGIILMLRIVIIVKFFLLIS
jgi:hypothetical protein